MKKMLLCVFFLATLSPLLTHASGLQISPAKLDFTIYNNKTSQQDMVIVNPTAEVQIFDIYPDDFDKQIKVEPASFVLESGARKTVKVYVYPKNLSNSQKISTDLSITGKPLSENKFSIGAGAKVPITITLLQADNKFSHAILWATLTVLVIFILCYFIYKKRLFNAKNSP